MATVLANILGGGAIAAIPKIIDSIKGHSPEDAAKLAEIVGRHNDLVLQVGLEQAKLDMSQYLAQTDINKTEAASSSFWVAGWRPYIGWICGTGLGIQFIVAPFFTWAATLFSKPMTFPPLDTGTLLTLLFAMLGLGGMRTAEKMKGVGSGLS